MGITAQRSTTKDRLSLCFFYPITDIWKTPFQTYIYHVDRFGHILTTIFSFLLSPVLPSTFNPQIITLCGPLSDAFSMHVFQNRHRSSNDSHHYVIRNGRLGGGCKNDRFPQTNFMNVFPSCRLPASKGSCTVAARKSLQMKGEIDMYC